MLNTTPSTKVEIPPIETYTRVTIHLPGELDVKMWRKMKLPEGWTRKPYYPDSYRRTRAEFFVKGFEALKRLQEDGELIKAKLLLICK